MVVSSPKDCKQSLERRAWALKALSSKLHGLHPCNDNLGLDNKLNFLLQSYGLDKLVDMNNVICVLTKVYYC
jgi:hypothetical protein